MVSFNILLHNPRLPMCPLFLKTAPLHVLLLCLYLWTSVPVRTKDAAGYRKYTICGAEKTGPT